MTTPNPQQFKPIVTVLWIALITAIIVTVIDWRIKQDILRMTTTFYKIYPWDKDDEKLQTNGPDNSDPVLPFPRLDFQSGVEKKDDAPTNSDDSLAWANYEGLLEASDSGGSEDSGSVPS